MRQQKQVGDVLRIGLDQVYTQLTVPGWVQREVYAGADLRRLDIEAYMKQHAGDDLLPWQRRVTLRRPLTPAERKKAKRDVREMVTRDMSIRADDVRIDDSVEESLAHLDLVAFRKNVRTIDQVAFFGPRLVTDAIADKKRLVLLGEPGSGKSTVLRYLTLTLAEAGLDKSVELPTRLAGWERLGDHQRLLPVLLPLLPFARRLAGQPIRAGAADDLWGYIAGQLEPGDIRTGLAAAVHAELAAGHVLLLLDGLDEVAGAESRRKVVRAVWSFAQEYPQCRIVVTCRVRAYEGEQNQAWQLPGWATTRLEEWNQAQMQHFVAAWYAAAVQAGGLPEARRDELAAALQRAVAASRDLQRLATRPLLLTIMALVHLNDGRLPEDRVTLYSRCIDILLGQWELRGKEQSEYGALTDYIGLPDRDVQRLRPLLSRAAFKAHEAGAADSPGQLGRETLRMMAADHLEQLGHPDPYRGAQKFLEYTDVRAGLLQASDAGDAYVFPHLTFQEYLAGLELVRDVDFIGRILERHMSDRWRVPILLGVGHLVSEGALAMPYQLLNELLTAEEGDPAGCQRDQVFAAEIATDVGWDRLEHGGATFKRLRRDMAQALALLVEAPVLPAAERVRAGVLLGQIGDPREDVSVLPPKMVPIKGGRFEIGDGKERTDLTIASFAIARYPITNAQYAQFLDDDGYDPAKPWWDDAGRAWLACDDAASAELEPWRRRQIKDRPEFWNDERFGSARPNHPVVDVSWYEAMAFCRWLSQHPVYNPQGYRYELPSEVEWEYAARGPERRPYPWGPKEPDGERANFNQIYKGTTAVGCFPRGATREGVMDLAGNVWEWTRSVYAPYPYDPNDGREDVAQPADKFFTIRGGGWVNSPLYLRASDRDYYPPEYHLYDLGFRLVRHPPRLHKE